MLKAYYQFQKQNNYSMGNSHNKNTHKLKENTSSIEQHELTDNNPVSAMYKEKAKKKGPSSSYAYPVSSHNTLTAHAQRSKTENIEQLPTIKQSTIYMIKNKKATYRGQFLNSLPEGEGEVCFSNGSYYGGDFKKGEADGRGVYVYSNGSIYVGQFRKSMFEGYGILENTAQNFRYEGDFLAGLPHGKGTEAVRNGNQRYEGEFKKGKKQGLGQYFWENGKRFEGYFMGGLMHGRGTLIAKDESIIFDGDFRNGKKQGYGILTTKNGSYEGNFEGDLLNGKGTFLWNDGKAYQGYFNKFLKNGQGTVYFSSGQYATGEWLEDHNISLEQIKNSSQAINRYTQIKNRHESNRRQSIQRFNEPFYEQEQGNESQSLKNYEYLQEE